MLAETGKTFGYVRACMDKRFVEPTRRAFEHVTGLGPTEYWMETYPGGTALPTNETGVQYAANHGASIFGWQAHGDTCGGQPGVETNEINLRLDERITHLKQKYPGKHFRIFATEKGIDIREV